MKLYHHPISANSRRVMLTVLQLGLENQVETEIVDLTQGQHRTEAFTAINPNQKVPVLVDGGRSIWESNAIMQYLAEKRPESGLFPKALEQRVEVVKWQFWNVAHFAVACGTFNWENLFKPRLMSQAPDPAALERAAPEVARFGRVLDDHLQGRQFVVGDALTLADLSLACALMFRLPAKIPVGEFSEIARWLEGIEALEAWKKTQPPAFG